MFTMSVSAAQAASFYSEVVAHGSVWTIRDERGYPAPLGASGERVQPFWSLQSRAKRVIGTVPAYAGFESVEISLEEFRERWLPGLGRDGLLVGLNWSGKRATGYDVAPPDVELALARAGASETPVRTASKWWPRKSKT